MTPAQVEILVGFIEEARARLHVPGAAFGILHDGETFTRGFGITSVENPLLVNADTLFQIGSVSKTFTATTVMRMVEMGQLDLDVPITTYLPNLRLTSDEVTQQITLRHLLNHTSGWDGDQFIDYGNGDDAGALYAANMYKLEQLNPPGTVWSYNNSGFNLAGHILEVVAGKPYESVVKELIFEPLGMSRTSFFPGEVMLHRFSVGHRAGDPPTVASPWPLPRTSNAAGAIASTANDMLRYARFFLSGGLTESGERLLKAETIVQMHAPFFTAGNFADSVGITFFQNQVGSVQLIGHGGSTNGFQAIFQLVPAQNFAFVGLTNVSNGSVFYHEVMDWALENLLGAKSEMPALLPLDDEQLGEFVGHYQATLTEVDVTLKDNQLWLQVTPRGGFPTRETKPPAGAPVDSSVRVSFYAPDKVVVLDPPYNGDRIEFLRSADGQLAWLRAGGRIHRPVKNS